MTCNLLEINDDCLTVIFNNLTVPELSDIASTCIRFQTIARRVFSSRHKSDCWIDVELCELNNDGDEDFRRRRQIATILRHFGDLMIKLKVTFNRWALEDSSFNTTVFNMMVMYCTGTLVRLELDYCAHLQHLQRYKIIDATALFLNVNELVMDKSDASIVPFLTDARQLTSLCLISVQSRNAATFLSNNYPHLRCLTLKNRNMDWDWCNICIDINNFLMRHSHLSELELGGGLGFYDLSLIEVRDRIRENSEIMPIAKLNKLAALRIAAFVDDEAVVEFLNTSRSSETLKDLALAFALDVDLQTSFARFNNLNCLCLNIFGDVGNAFLACLHCLPQLRILSIKAFMSITSDGLVGLVHNLTHLEQLNLVPASDWSDIQHIQLRKSTYLRICEIYRNRNRKLEIRNYDMLSEIFQSSVWGLEEPYAEHNQQEFVQFISVEPMIYDSPTSFDI